jgi:hypothetical protein
MRVIVTGWRSSNEDWLQAQQQPVQELPRLSGDQKATAAKLGISEEDYARSVYASELSRRELSAKGERFGELLQTVMRERRPDASVHTIELRTFDGTFQIVAIAGNRDVRFRIGEELVDNLLGSGSKELEANLARIVDLNLPSTGTMRAS